MDFYHNRRTQLLRGGKADEVDAYLVTHRPNVRYLTGLDAADAVLVTPKGTFALCREELTGLFKGAGADITPVPRADGVGVEQSAAEAVHKAGSKAVGVEAEHLPVAALQRLTAGVGKTPVRPLGGRVDGLRATKDPSEVEAVRKAIKTAERAMLMFRAILREADHEVDLCRQMDQLLLRAGADAAAFPSVVAVGDNGGEPLLRPTTDKPVGESSRLFVRWGAVADGYCGVVTRTFRSPFGAPPLRKTKHERTAYSYEKVGAAVRQAVKAALDAIQAEATIGDLAAAAHAQIAAAGFEAFTAPEVGCGVGLEPREGPFVRPGDKSPLLPGTVLTLAPVVRIPGWGRVQYTTTVVVNREGYTDLGGSPAADD